MSVGIICVIFIAIFPGVIDCKGSKPADTCGSSGSNIVVFNVFFFLLARACGIFRCFFKIAFRFYIIILEGVATRNPDTPFTPPSCSYLIQKCSRGPETPPDSALRKRS